MDGAERWRAELEAWAIPRELLDKAPENPWALGAGRFAQRARDALAQDTPSRRRALEGLPEGGTVLDVGCGGGAAGLPLAPPAASVLGVDENPAMLDAFAEGARERGVDATTVAGRWPDVAAQAPPADVVVCHHVLYNVHDLPAFATALTEHARHRVVVEIPTTHPRSWLAPYWRALHGIERPTGPTADLAIQVLEGLGLGVHVERWRQRSGTLSAPVDELVPLVRRALCLTPDRDPDVRAAVEADPPAPDRDVATLWWNGSAPPNPPG